MTPPPLSDAKQAKAVLRRAMLERLRAMPVAAMAEASLNLCRVAAALPAFRAARTVGLFAPLATEPDLHPLIEEAWAHRQVVALPLILRAESTDPLLEWREVRAWKELVIPGPFGLREPDPERCRLVDPAELDLAFVPGVAFDAAGTRLGRGGGFYDRFLSHAPTGMPAIGLMFALQKVAEVPREPHDQPLRRVVTEED
jgi:5-formyltetrahydrofolate cyclo-ligase